MNPDAALFDPTQVYLEIPQTAQVQSWQKSQSFSTPNSRWNAYLNQLCLSTILPWLQDEYTPEARVWPNAAALPSFWEVVNGTAIGVDGARFVIIPTETIDLSELRVPQEWVDIPEWAADYYFAAQVNPDDGWVRIWGYCTHQQLKTKGRYEASDRTYCINDDDLIKDINVLWVARQLCPEAVTKSEIAPLQDLSLAQAENLLQRLGSSAIVVPRLAVPFERWGALLRHSGWRQRLYEWRQGLPEQWSVGQWLQANVSNFAQQLGWQRLDVQPSYASAREAGQTSEIAVLSRQLLIAGQPYELRVIPQGSPEQRTWRFELQRSSLNNLIPAGLKLKLLTEDLQAFENNEDIATTAIEQLYIEVALNLGEGIVWEIEPTPENFEWEILRF